MLAGSLRGLVQSYVNPDTGARLVGLRADVAIGSWLAMMFALAHWPAPLRAATFRAPGTNRESP